MIQPLGTMFTDIGNGLRYAAEQCTAFVADTLRWVPAGWGNAGNWLHAAGQAGYSIGSQPLPGAIAVYLPNTGGAFSEGHVAVVQSVQSNGLPILQEANWSYPTINGVGRMDTRAATASTAPTGYIYGPPGTVKPVDPFAAALSTTASGIGGIIGTPLGALMTTGNPLDAIKALPAAFVASLGTGVAQMFTTLGHGIAGTLGVAETDVAAFASNHLIPVAVAAVVLAALFA
jgi:CHAP domain